MTLLLDTHAFLWFCMAPEKLGTASRRAIRAAGSEVFVSAVSFWEISLKCGIGKLDLDNVTPEELPGVAEASGLGILSMKADVAATFHKLPNTGHKDPFDRMLAWQAIDARMTMITRERFPDEYGQAGLKVLW
jgi:PIN domain nuclease of toxin-antitoxin system